MDVLDPTILVDRSGEGLNYIPTLSLAELPRSSPSRNLLPEQPGPRRSARVQSREGKIMGILCRCISAEGGDSNDMTELMSRLVATTRLILPAADIAKLVPEAKEEMKKPATPKRNEGKSGLGPTWLARDHGA